MERRAQLSTRILDYHGKIGPFFFKEFLFVFLGCTTLVLLMVVLSLLMEISISLFVVVPGSLLGVMGLIRFFLAKRISSPWYIQKWIAQHFLRPKHIVAGPSFRKLRCKKGP